MTPSTVHRATMFAAHACTASSVQGPVQYATTGSPYKRFRVIDVVLTDRRQGEPLSQNRVGRRLD